MTNTPSQHTPGPWTISGTTIKDSHDDNIVSGCQYCYPECCPLAKEADLRLIALAPRMFEFIRDITKLDTQHMSLESLSFFLKEEARQIIEEIDK